MIAAQHDLGLAARIANAALGTWLAVSVFLWPHTDAQRVNAVLAGIFIALTALTAWSYQQDSRARLLNVALGFWLLVSILAFPVSAETKLNSAIVAVLVIVFALVPRHHRRHGRLAEATL